MSSRVLSHLKATQKHTAMATSVAAADKSKPYIPLASGADDGYSNEDEATATCFCGTVQLAFVSLALETARLGA